MTPDTILYVDDEAMALKYFERLVSPMAKILTASSVDEGKEILRTQGDKIAVLITDQRMPGAYGNELLSYARTNHPLIVRMLTTAYSELGDAIQAINSGEIYRYITKPWDLESLRADLKNALELAELRGERDGLVREKMHVHQQQLLASRISQLTVACQGFVKLHCAPALLAYFEGVWSVGCSAPVIDWRVMDHADLMQYEASRSATIGVLLAQWQSTFGAVPASKTDALAALSRALPDQVRIDGETAFIANPKALSWILEAAPLQEPAPDNVAILAWLLWLGEAGKNALSVPARLKPHEGGIAVSFATSSAPVANDWMADAIERITEAAMSPD